MEGGKKEVFNGQREGWGRDGEKGHVEEFLREKEDCWRLNFR